MTSTLAAPPNTWHANDRLCDAITSVSYQCATCGQRGRFEPLPGRTLGGEWIGPCGRCGERWWYPLRIVYRVALGDESGPGRWYMR